MRNADAMTRKLRENRVGRRARLARRGAASAGEDARDRRADARDRARGVPARFPPLAGRDAVPTPEIRRGARFAHRAMPSQTLNGVARQRLRRETGERHRRRRRTRRGDGRRWRTYHLFFPNLALLACASLKGTARVLGRGDGARRKTRSRTRRATERARKLVSRFWSYAVSVTDLSHVFFADYLSCQRMATGEDNRTLPRRKKRP
jgi:hypothetical protein